MNPVESGFPKGIEEVHLLRGDAAADLSFSESEVVISFKQLRKQLAWRDVLRERCPTGAPHLLLVHWAGNETHSVARC